MRNSGIAIFLIFFGASLVDALALGQWVRAGFWLIVGVLFLLMDRAGRKA
jgi:hypothetical protein